MLNAAKLIVSALTPLATRDDPARPLDMFPRELDLREETAQPLVDAVWDHLSAVRIVADGEGELRAPSDLKLHPIDNEEAIKQWWQLATPDIRGAFVHPTCYRGQRLNRLKFLLKRDKKKETDDDNDNGDDKPSLESWLEQIASPDLTQTREVFKLSKQLAEKTNDYNVRMQLRRAKVIPTAQEDMASAAGVVIATGVVPAGKSAVHADIATDKQCAQILDLIFGVKPLDGAQWRAVLDQALNAAVNAWSHAQDEAWTNLWSELRNAPQTVSVEFINAAASRMRVRSGAGKWELPSQVLRPGAIVADHPNIASVLLDQKFHANDEHLLSALNILSEPRNELIAWSRDVGDAYETYQRAVRLPYSSILSAKRKNPNWSYLDFIGNAKVLAGAPLLPQIPFATRGKLTALLLDQLNPQALQRVRFGHTTRPDVYNSIEVPSPTCWLLAHYGVVDFGATSVTIRDLIAAKNLPWAARLPGWGPALSKLNNLLSSLFGEWLPPAGDLKTLWPAAFAACEAPEVPAEVRRHCYEGAAPKGHVPARVIVSSALVPLAECYVTSSDALAAQAQKANVAVVVLNAEASEIWCAKGAKNLASVARIEHDGIAPDALSLLDVAPEIAPALTEDGEAKASILALQL